MKMKQGLFFVIVLLLSMVSFGQIDSSSVPYLRSPTVPAFELRRAADSSRYTKSNLPKDKALLLILFSPTCDHCQQETEEIQMNIDKFKDIHIVMATGTDFAEVKKFYKEYKMKLFPGITVCREGNYVLAPFYGLRTLPFLAMYDKKGRLLGAHEGNLTVKEILEFYE